MTEILTCPDEHELLPTAMGDPAVSTIQRHLAVCPGCRGRLERLRAEVSAMRLAFGNPADGDPSARPGSPENPDEGPERLVGRYRLLEEIGRGAQGIVYRAREEGLAMQEVAVKLLKAGTIDDEGAAVRFIREVRYLAGIHHDHIVPYQDSGNDCGQLYYAMRLMPGASLEERPGPMVPMEAARLLSQLAEAVHHLHTQPHPIVHRDLNPKNILFDQGGRPYIADFGLAVLFESGGSSAWACGTIPYIAPEQFDRRFGELGPACDLYSLGVILYKLLTGRTPFPGTRDAILPTLEQEPIPPSHLRAAIPREIERICLKCLRKKTMDRYRSAGELLEDLRSFEMRRPLPHTPAEGPPRRLADWARREPALAVRLGVILACSTIIWGYRLAIGDFAALLPGHWAQIVPKSGLLGSHPPMEPILVGMNQAILIAWGLAS